MKEEILRLLRSADGYISGQELCNRFGVSRTAVWKAINQLKEAGYEIEAQQNKGYRLMAAPDLMTEAEIKSLMHTEWVAKEVLYFPGESIKVLRFNPFVAWEAYEDWERARNYQLLIGTRERRVPENECGIMRLYDVPNLMGDLIKKKEYKKLGKIVDIVYKERKK